VWVRKGGTSSSATSPATSLTSGTPKLKDHHVLQPSGFTGSDRTGVGREQTNAKLRVNYGSNGITLDRQGRVVFNAMGDRAVVAP